MFRGLLVLLCASVLALAQDCKGAFDVYLILDKSGSVGVHWATQEVVFVQNIVSNLTNPRTRFAFITFDSASSIVMDMTGDRTAIQNGIDQLKALTANGGTNIGAGIANANSILRQRQPDGRIPIFFVLSDGVDQGTNTFQEADTARSLGANVYSIGVGTGINQQQLERIANQPPSVFTFMAADFDQLGTKSFAEQLTARSCIEVTSVTPSSFCVGSTTVVQVTGRGFNLTQDKSFLRCKFGNVIAPATLMSNNEIQCTSPAFNFTSTYNLEIQIYTFAYTQSNVTFVVVPCLPATSSPNRGWIAAIVLVPLLLFLLWFLWPLIVGRRRDETTAAAAAAPYAALSDEPESAAAGAALPPGKLADGTWSKVDTSKYVWSRDGGTARPLPVQWGEKGAVQSAAHLESTTVIVGTPPPEVVGGSVNAEAAAPKDEGCCDGCARSCSSCWGGCLACYAKCASCRPHRG